MELTFEPLQREDLAACYALCMQSFSESVPLEEVEQTFALCSRDPSYRLVVGKLDGRVVTYATLHFFHTVFDGMRIHKANTPQSVSACSVGYLLFHYGSK